jgi:hypothetical protein
MRLDIHRLYIYSCYYAAVHKTSILLISIMLYCYQQLMVRISQVDQMIVKVEGLQKVVNPPSHSGYLISEDMHIASAAVTAVSSITIRSPTYDHVKMSAREIIITCSISLCPVESVWSSISLWKKNFILHS